MIPQLRQQMSNAGIDRGSAGRTRWASSSSEMERYTRIIQAAGIKKDAL